MERYDVFQASLRDEQYDMVLIMLWILAHAEPALLLRSAPGDPCSSLLGCPQRLGTVPRVTNNMHSTPSTQSVGQQCRQRCFALSCLYSRRTLVLPSLPAVPSTHPPAAAPRRWWLQVPITRKEACLLFLTSAVRSFEVCPRAACSSPPLFLPLAARSHDGPPEVALWLKSRKRSAWRLRGHYCPVLCFAMCWSTLRSVAPWCTCTLAVKRAACAVRQGRF